MYMHVRVGTVGITEKLPLPFSVHYFLAIQPAGQPFNEQTASDMIGYSLSNDWNTVSGMPVISKCLPNNRNVNAISRRPLIG